MDLKEKIEMFERETKEIVSANPDIAKVEWQLTNLEYPEFKEVLDIFKKEPTIHSNKMFAILNLGKCQVILWTKELKISTSIQVAEN